MLLSVLALAAMSSASECAGCHTPSRAVPPARFEVGLGRWTEGSCFGCHREMNDVAREGVLSGRKDARYWALPLSEEKRAQITSAPLSFTSAPEHVALSSGPFLRIDSLRLLDFLRRPVDVRRVHGESDRMMAYPDLSWDEMPDVLAAVSNRRAPTSTGVCEAPRRTPAPSADGASADAAPSPSLPSTADRPPAQVWETSCRGCHDSVTSTSGRPPAYLALFTGEWLHAYANGLAQRPGDAGRTMPVVPVSRAEAAGLYAYLGERRTQKAAELDDRVARIDTREVERRTAGRALTPDERTFVWEDFLRAGKCVHCHSAKDHRAQQRFDSSPRGLQRYVRANGGMAIWRRLEVRVLEADVGIGAAAPGMPMTSAPLSGELRDLIYVWARERCPAPDGRPQCAPGSPSVAKKKP